jgi:hypothetical protein
VLERLAGHGRHVHRGFRILHVVVFPSRLGRSLR